MSIKPVVIFKGVRHNSRTEMWGFLSTPDVAPQENAYLYEIPDTHQIMPVKLTEKMIAAALPELMREGDEDKYRALGQLICVWDELVEAAREEQKQ